MKVYDILRHITKLYQNISKTASTVRFDFSTDNYETVIMVRHNFVWFLFRFGDERARKFEQCFGTVY